ncbi:unnamed protein product [Polarella glacialis]|uniref:Uncharacterized protein n=1 Tax=Polarella glacialis TaxID=89957 RepID=A0A813HK80_POLGL|nr:unnamed protein product [Polarella glacialis]
MGVSISFDCDRRKSSVISGTQPCAATPAPNAAPAAPTAAPAAPRAPRPTKARRLWRFAITSVVRQLLRRRQWSAYGKYLQRQTQKNLWEGLTSVGGRLQRTKSLKSPGQMNHTPTGWSAPGEVATPITIDSSADRSADRSRSDHGVRPGRPVACVAPKAITDRVPQHHIIHSDVEKARAEEVASGDESEEDDLIADAEYAIQQKELDILRLRRDMVARRANKSKKPKASSGGDIDDILGMMADEDNTRLDAGVLRDHEKNVSLAATQEASSSSAGALVHPPGLMLRDGAYHLDSGLPATTEVTQDVVHTYTPT